jgi:hypothetical protein
LPNGKHRSAERFFVCGRFLGGQLQAVPIVKQFGDVPLAIAYALARDLGWMGGKDGADKRSVKKRFQLSQRYACIQRTPERASNTALTRVCSGHFVRSVTPNMMLILRDVRQMREGAESTCDLNYCARR